MSWRIVTLTIEGDSFVGRFADGAAEIEVCADVAFLGNRIAVLSGFHIQGPGANTVGLSTLFSLARWVKVELDVDQLRIEGALRTSGACPGRIPRPLAF